MSKADELAFPVVTPPTCVVYGKGLTKREMFAAMAMQGMLLSGKSFVWMAADAVECADALLAELAKGKE